MYAKNSILAHFKQWLSWKVPKSVKLHHTKKASLLESAANFATDAARSDHKCQYTEK